MKRKDYEKPAMKVIELKQRTMLLVGSNGDGSLQDYNWNTPSEE